MTRNPSKKPTDPELSPLCGSTGTIILCGGQFNAQQLLLGEAISNAMIPVNGRPVIGWILDDLLSKQLTDATVVLRADDQQLASFLERAYAPRMNLTQVKMATSPSILHSLQAGLSKLSDQKSVRIILGDTLIRDTFQSSDDFVYTADVTEASRWCIATTNAKQEIATLQDKATNQPGSLTALAGYYHLKDSALLQSLLKQAIADGDRELSSVLIRYAHTRPIATRTASSWYDFGHMDHLIHARRNLLNSRHFNKLQVDSILNLITKTSENQEKLQDELAWYLSLPDPLGALTPRVFPGSDHGRELIIEYYGYPNLAELFVFGQIPTEHWRSVLHHLLAVHRVFGQHTAPLSAENVKAMYLDKTLQRLGQLKDQHPAWEELLQEETLRVNGQRLLNIEKLLPLIMTKVEQLTLRDKGAIIHGDFCFSNILYDINHQIVRLIDPRGRFGEQGLFGDPRYDIAKLRHSVCGMYDFIVSDLFSLQRTKKGYTTSIFTQNNTEAVGTLFDQLIEAEGYNLREIQFIEGLLFLSMTPLHAEHPLRQQMMFLTGLQRLNDVLSQEQP